MKPTERSMRTYEEKMQEILGKASTGSRGGYVGPSPALTAPRFSHDDVKQLLESLQQREALIGNLDATVSRGRSESDRTIGALSSALRSESIVASDAIDRLNSRIEAITYQRAHTAVVRETQDAFDAQRDAVTEALAHQTRIAKNAILAAVAKSQRHMQTTTDEASEYLRRASTLSIEHLHRKQEVPEATTRFLIQALGNSEAQLAIVKDRVASLVSNAVREQYKKELGRASLDGILVSTLVEDGVARAAAEAMRGSIEKMVQEEIAKRLQPATQVVFEESRRPDIEFEVTPRSSPPTPAPKPPEPAPPLAVAPPFMMETEPTPAADGPAPSPPVAPSEFPVTIADVAKRSSNDWTTPRSMPSRPQVTNIADITPVASTSVRAKSPASARRNQLPKFNPGKPSPLFLHATSTVEELPLRDMKLLGLDKTKGGDPVFLGSMGLRGVVQKSTTPTSTTPERPRRPPVGNGPEQFNMLSPNSRYSTAERVVMHELRTLRDY